MSGASNYSIVGPSSAAKGFVSSSKPKSLVRDIGSVFHTGINTHDEGSRIRLVQASHPVMSGQVSEGLKTTSAREDSMQRKSLERAYRADSIKGRSSWSHLKPIVTRDEPYIADARAPDERVRFSHRELEKQTPL